LERRHTCQSKVTSEIIRAAIEGFGSQERRIDSQIDELRQVLNGGSAEPDAESGSPFAQTEDQRCCGGCVLDLKRQRYPSSNQRMSSTSLDSHPGFVVSVIPRRAISSSSTAGGFRQIRRVRSALHAPAGSARNVRLATALPDRLDSNRNPAGANRNASRTRGRSSRYAQRLS
jgi:hypothetical protein